MLDQLNRHDLTEEEWERLRVLLPADPPRGGRWADHRAVINGVFFRTRAGCPRRDLPPVFGNWKTIYNRHRRWSLGGTWEKILDRLRAGCDEAEGKDWRSARVPPLCGLTSTRPAPAACRPPSWSWGAAANDKNALAAGTNREALGRSRGGLTTKIHLIADRRCRPVTQLLSPGQHADCPRFIPLMETIRIARLGTGRPRTEPAAAMGDKAYSSAANHLYLRRRGITAVIPVKDEQKANRRRGRR